MHYDLAIIGGGPAGMMAAIIAARRQKKVVLLEKNNRLGVKLLITGKGRCNLTNATYDLKNLVARYGQNGKFLFSAFYTFGVGQTLEFFESLGLKIKIERGNRVFPVSDKSQDVLAVLVKEMKKNKVEIKLNAEVKNLFCQNKKIKKAILNDKQEISAKNFLICTGGKSYPATGSTGDGYQWLKKMGHTVISPSPALCPVVCKESWLKDLEGAELKNIEINVLKNNKKIDSRLGEAIFTDKGLSGPIVLDLSSRIGALLPGRVCLQIDFKPALNLEQLDKRIQKDFAQNSKKMFKNGLDKLLPQKLIPTIIKLSAIKPDMKIGEITRQQRQSLVKLLKEFTLNVSSLAGFNRAVITVGGVKINEIDPKKMKSNKISNLYLAGEIIDVAGPTGGYNLQVCWSTGYLVGINI